MKLRNETRNSVVATDVVVARSLWSRCVGLLGRRSMANGEAMWLKPCNGVHTFGMRFAIDVLTLDASLRVLRIDADVRPWRIVWPIRGGYGTVELPSGAARRSGVHVGDQLRFD